MNNKPIVILFYLIIQVFLLNACGNKSSETGGNVDPVRQDTSMKYMQDQMLEQAFRESALNGDAEIVRTLLESGQDVNAADQEGRTALMFAAFNGHLGIVKELIEAGAEVDKRDFMDRTALLYASTGNFPKTVELLMNHGADPNIIDNNEHFTSLMHAAAEGHMDVVRLLIERGADPHLKDVDGDDAESFARLNGHIEVADYIGSIK